jgi:hypothetical protein
MEDDSMSQNKRENRVRVWLIRTALALLCLYLLLLIPDSEPELPDRSAREPFLWDRDAYWSGLETQFASVRTAACDTLGPQVDSILAICTDILDRVHVDSLAPEAPLFLTLESTLFDLSVYIPACPHKATSYATLLARLRYEIKRASQRWDMDATVTRHTMYRLLYGSRAAYEEVMLQLPASTLPVLLAGTEEPSACPSGELRDLTVHSGDILVSRGGAATSALIARGNDFPGNFSHVALVYVDEDTRRVHIVESHIEIGVAIATPEEYFKDKKLRVMVLRPRADLPQLLDDPLLPHRAAKEAYDRAQSEHIPYDFAMDFDHNDKLFCSEVAFAPYRNHGLTLWSGLSYISSSGLQSWLAAFGVRHFETHEPSDLEYDPQLRVVAEWRDPATLFLDHVDNAVVDVLLEGAERGNRLQYNRWLLPGVRVMKGWCWLLNRFGKAGPVPEGMSATSALRNTWFSAHHARIREELVGLAEDFREKTGFRPPYWTLVSLAREAEQSVLSGQSSR